MTTIFFSMPLFYVLALALMFILMLGASFSTSLMLSKFQYSLMKNPKWKPSQEDMFYRCLAETLHKAFLIGIVGTIFLHLSLNLDLWSQTAWEIVKTIFLAYLPVVAIWVITFFAMMFFVSTWYINKHENKKK